MTMLEDDLVGLTGSIWESVLGLPADAVPPVMAWDRLAGPTVTSSVNITGDWNGSVALTFAPGLTRVLAAGMFGLGEDELDDELVRDAVGELANIAGGNVKGMVPGETELSLPQIIEGEGYTISVPGARVLVEAGFFCAGAPFVVRIHGRTDLPV